MAGAGRVRRGRQRIGIRRIERQEDLYATFSKRRVGLYKKASVLSTLCDVDIGIIIFSPTLHPHSFFHPNLESVVDRYRNPHHPPNLYARTVDSTTRSRIHHFNTSLDHILDHKDQLKHYNKHLDQIDLSRDKAWWEQIPTENLSLDQLKDRIAWFQANKAKVETRIQLINNGGVGPSSHQDPIFHNPDLMSEDQTDFCYPPMGGGGGGALTPAGQFCFPPPAPPLSPTAWDPFATGEESGGQDGLFDQGPGGN